MKFKNELTIVTPQGLGDIFWIIQKLKGNTLHLKIPIIVSDRLQQRAAEWLDIFPSISTVEFVPISSQCYEYFLASSNLLVDKAAPQYFVLNSQLEEGIRLEACWPTDTTWWNIDLPEQSLRGKTAKEFDILYVSKSILDPYPRLDPKHGVWEPKTWAHFVKLFWEKFGQRPLVIIGADYDLRAMTEVCALLPEGSAKVITTTPRQAVYLIKRCEHFIGYQSGICVMADNFHKKTVMLYFNRLGRLMYSWNNPNHENYRPFLFKTKPETIIQQLQWTP